MADRRRRRLPRGVDGRVKWILDGYTTTDHYPNSQKDSLRSMTSDALSPNTTYATLPTDEINYMRNSVKAVVDAYDGTRDALRVGRHRPDPEGLGGGVPGHRASRSPTIPRPARSTCATPRTCSRCSATCSRTYHVTNPKTFYGGSDQWKVPEDPENHANKQPPYRLSVRTPDTGHVPVFSLTSVFVPNKRQNLAVVHLRGRRRRATDYGKIRILRLPEQHAGARAVADREQLRPGQRHPEPAARVHQGELEGDLRQPADAAGRRRPALRPAALRPARVRRGLAIPRCATCWCRSARTSASAPRWTRRSPTCSGRSPPARCRRPARSGRQPAAVEAERPAARSRATCGRCSRRPSRSSRRRRVAAGR